jgi:quinol monooxygenase YgiN
MNDGKLTIVAKIFAKEERRDLVKSELIKLIEPTRAEEGCINYDLHQDHKNPNLFVFLENWESSALLQKHLANTHIKAYQKATEGAIESFELQELKQIG